MFYHPDPTGASEGQDPPFFYMFPVGARNIVRNLRPNCINEKLRFFPSIRTSGKGKRMLGSEPLKLAASDDRLLENLIAHCATHDAAIACQIKEEILLLLQE